MKTWECSLPVKGVIVLVHGSGEHYKRYEWLISRFTDAGYHVVSGNLPGHGEEAATPGHINSFNDYLDEISLWVAKAFEFSGLPVFLFGHSLGGLCVIRWLQENKAPLSGVLLSSPCLALAFQIPLPLRLIAKVLNAVRPAQLVGIKKSGANPHATRNTAILERDRNDPVLLRRVSARWFHELEQAMLTANTDYRKFPDVPLCIMQAGEDKVVSKQHVHTWYENVRLNDKYYKEWDGLFHEVTNEPEREEVVEEMLSFLSTIINRRTSK